MTTKATEEMLSLTFPGNEKVKSWYLKVRDSEKLSRIFIVPKIRGFCFFENGNEHKVSEKRSKLFSLRIQLIVLLEGLALLASL